MQMKKQTFRVVAGHGDNSEWEGYAIDDNSTEMSARKWAGAPLVQINVDDPELAKVVFEAVKKWRSNWK